ncbi:MAG TPA: penicillin acylase family protein, partial [Candidatus Obscuribacterales bacterium]
HTETIVPPEVRWTAALPKMVASNNWVVAGSKTRSGRAMLANDPHLEGNRLPNVWYEAVLETPERYAIGATMPGLPGLLLGRSSDLAWGATYTFMDAVDSWVEDCRDGQYRRVVDGKEEWLPFIRREETIQRKGLEPHQVSFYENEHGTLNQAPDSDGYYLATRWASSLSGGESLNRISEMWSATSVTQGMEILGGLETSWNWVLADSAGHIGYQMSGLMPRRREGVSGLVPVPGWLPENDWQGFVPPDQLPRAYDPEAGYFVTANQDLNAWGLAKPINMPMGAYRAERISELLEQSDQLTVRDFQQIQLDRLSPQARAFMALLRPLLPQTDNGCLLRDWDCCYEPDSKGAMLFERVYAELVHQVFGAGLGADVCSTLQQETGILADFYANFDQILLSDHSPWFGGESREKVYRRAIEHGLEGEVRPWGSQNRFIMRHLLFGGKFPPAAGFDHGPLPIPGGRATPQQGQIYRSGGRETSFVPSFRLVTDFAAAGTHTCLLGGPSDRSLSKWYTSEVANWQQGVYKYLAPIKI